MIKTELIFHKNKEQIKLVFGFDDSIKAKVRTIAGVAWSKTNKAWLVPNDLESQNALKSLFPNISLPTTEITEPIEEQQIDENFEQPKKQYYNRDWIVIEVLHK